MGYYLALEWNPTTRNTIRLSGSRGLEETIWGNNRYFIDTGIDLYASHKLTDKFTVAATFGYDKLNYNCAAKRYYKSYLKNNKFAQNYSDITRRIMNLTETNKSGCELRVI